jgi:hypothetical protein
MPLSYTRWKERFTQRTDLSSCLVHLTRGTANQSAVDVLIKILVERKLKGSDPKKAFVHGNKPVVCFQDVPLNSIADNIAFERKFYPDRNRYSGCGLVFHKSHIYACGGRPVVYDDPATAKNYIPNQAEHWRIVAFDLSGSDFIDWTHEREWRVPGDLQFDLTNVGILLDTPKSYREFVFKCRKLTTYPLDKLCGIVVLAGLLV